MLLRQIEAVLVEMQQKGLPRLPLEERTYVRGMFMNREQHVTCVVLEGETLHLRVERLVLKNVGIRNAWKIPARVVIGFSTETRVGFAASSHDESVADNISAEFPSGLVLDLIDGVLRPNIAKGVGKSFVGKIVVDFVDFAENPVEPGRLRRDRFLRPRPCVGQWMHGMFGPLHAVG